MYGNPDLKPEKTLTEEIALIYSADNGLIAGLTLFNNEFSDKITRVPCPECGPPNQFGRESTTYTNVDDAVTRGVEATLSAPLSDTLSMTSSYTRSEEHTSELQSLMRISYAVFCLKKKNNI